MNVKLMLATSIVSTLAAELLITAQVPMAAPAQPAGRYPHLREALAELHEARREVRDAPADFGGHRDAAVRAITDAIGSTRAVLQIRDGDTLPARRGDDDAYRQYRNYPRLRQALHDLREAREELEEASADAGNLKDRALADIRVAIREVRTLVRWADEHGRRR